MKGRALTDEQKEEIVRRLLVAWKALPALRFGQMLGNAIFTHPMHTGPRLLHLEDEPLVEQVEALVQKYGKKP